MNMYKTFFKMNKELIAQQGQLLGTCGKHEVLCLCHMPSLLWHKRHMYLFVCVRQQHVSMRLLVQTADLFFFSFP